DILSRRGNELRALCRGQYAEETHARAHGIERRRGSPLRNRGTNPRAQLVESAVGDLKLFFLARSPRMRARANQLLFLETAQQRIDCAAAAAPVRRPRKKKLLAHDVGSTRPAQPDHAKNAA